MAAGFDSHSHANQSKVPLANSCAISETIIIAVYQPPLQWTQLNFKYLEDSLGMMCTSEVNTGMMCTSEVKLMKQFHEVLQLKKRLKHLEEETNLMKQEMFKERAERKTMLNDVYRQLKLLHFSLHSQNQTFCKEDGLCQVLYDDRNPSVFIRGGLEASSLADPRPAERIMRNVLCIEYDK